MAQQWSSFYKFFLQQQDGYGTISAKIWSVTTVKNTDYKMWVLPNIVQNAIFIRDKVGAM